MKKIVLVGGCFDILHIGHITFLEKAKAAGNFLVVLLESDETIKKLKGEGRPINSQKDRAAILASLCMVDQVISLPVMKDSDYDQLVTKIKPVIIATTAGDPALNHKKRVAKLVGAKIKVVTKQVQDRSTTRLLNLLKG